MKKQYSNRWILGFSKSGSEKLDNVLLLYEIARQLHCRGEFSTVSDGFSLVTPVPVRIDSWLYRTALTRTGKLASQFQALHHLENGI